MTIWQRREVQATAALLLMGAVYVWQNWNRAPVVEFDNLKYVQLLTTAVSARNEQWLAGVETAVDQRLSEGAMSKAERAHFSKVIDIARDGNWQAADQACYAFARDQLSRRRSKPASHVHEH